MHRRTHLSRSSHHNYHRLFDSYNYIPRNDNTIFVRGDKFVASYTKSATCDQDNANDPHIYLSKPQTTTETADDDTKSNMDNKPRPNSGYCDGRYGCNSVPRLSTPRTGLISRSQVQVDAADFIFHASKEKKAGYKFADWLQRCQKYVSKQRLMQICGYLENNGKIFVEDFCAAQGLKRLSVASLYHVCVFSFCHDQSAGTGHTKVLFVVLFGCLLYMSYVFRWITGRYWCSY